MTTKTSKPSYWAQLKNLNFFKRFPLTTTWLLLVLVGALLGDTCYLLNTNYLIATELCQSETIMTLSHNFNLLALIAIPISLSVDIFLEKNYQKKSKLLRLGAFLATLIIYLVFFGFENNWWESPLKSLNISLVYLATSSLFLIIPFWKKDINKIEEKNFWLSQHKLLFQQFKGWLLGIGFLFAILAFNGISSNLFSGNNWEIFSVYNLGSGSFLSRTLWATLLYFILVPYVFGSYPFTEELKRQDLQKTWAFKFLRFVTKHLLVPFVVALGVLLLSFLIFKFPEIIESNVLLPAVLTFGFIGSFTYFLSYFYEKESEWFLVKFRKFFTWSVTILSFVTVTNGLEKGGDFLNSQYGLVDFFPKVFLPGLFLVIGLYFSFSKNKKLPMIYVSVIGVLGLFVIMSRLASFFIT